MPRELWIDVRGTVTVSLDEAIEAYWTAANQLLPSLAVAGNGPIADSEVHLALLIDEDGSEHDFFENFQPDEVGAPRHGRSLAFPETIHLLEALVASQHSPRLLRACAFYREAMAYLRPGQEVLQAAFLWMAVEALTKVALRRSCANEGCSDDELVVRWGLCADGADEEKILNATRRLDGEARRRLIFHGDAQCQRDAVRASDGFEHGFEDFLRVRVLAKRALADGLAGHVRRAILELADLRRETTELLTGERFAEPRANWRITKYIRGKFVGPPERLAEEGQEYPALRWEGRIRSFERAGSAYSLSFDENFSVRAGEGVTFQATSLEIWGPQNDPVAASTTEAPDGELPEREEPT